MKKLVSPTLIVLLLMLALAACTSKEPVNSSGTSPEPSMSPPPSEPSPPASSVTPLPATNKPAVADVTLSVDVLTDEAMRRFASVNEFIEFEDEDYQKIVIAVSAAVKNFKWIEVVVQGTESAGINYETNELLSLDELTPQKPFVVTWMNQGMLPHRGISFVDENNSVRRFYINMDTSGEADTPLTLVEF